MTIHELPTGSDRILEEMLEMHLIGKTMSTPELVLMEPGDDQFMDVASACEFATMSRAFGYILGMHFGHDNWTKLLTMVRYVIRIHASGWTSDTISPSKQLVVLQNIKGDILRDLPQYLS